MVGKKRSNVYGISKSVHCVNWSQVNLRDVAVCKILLLSIFNNLADSPGGGIRKLLIFNDWSWGLTGIWFLEISINFSTSFNLIIIKNEKS